MLYGIPIGDMELPLVTVPTCELRCIFRFLIVEGKSVTEIAEKL